jgi:hypothetical protein
VTDTLASTIDHVTQTSALDRIRQRRAELEAGVLLDIPIPGYNGELVARFAKLTPEELQETAQEAFRARSKSADAQLTVAANIVTKHVREVCGVHANGRHAALDPDDPMPIRFDDRLAALMRLDLPPDWNPRLVLFAVLTRGQEAGVQGMASQLLAWSAGLSEEARETLEGESEATLP